MVSREAPGDSEIVHSDHASTPSNEKDDVFHNENVNDHKIEEGTLPPSRFTKEEEEAVIRKLDWHLMPLIFVLYSLSVLDRSNLGNARISGMEDDIDLS